MASRFLVVLGETGGWGTEGKGAVDGRGRRRGGGEGIIVNVGILVGWFVVWPREGH